MALTDYQTLVTRMVRDASGKVDTDDRDRAIAAAVAHYSRDLPRTIVKDVSWSATGHFQAVPDELLVDQALLSCEQLPAQVPPVLLGMSIYLTPSVMQLVAEDAIGAGTDLRLTFTAAHLVDADTDTVPAGHLEAVASFAAHLLCRQLAAHFSGERESSIGADGSNTESRARNFAQRAKDYRGAYYSLLGIVDPLAGSAAGGSSGGSAAGAVVSWGSRNRNWLRTNGPSV